jgi:ATP-dependent Clp protease ATP-binding subunit ClpC
MDIENMFLKGFFKGLSKATVKAVLLAEEETRRLSHRNVGSEALLLGMIGAGGLAARALKLNNINLKQSRIEVEKIIGRGTGSPINIPFTPRVSRIFERAWATAREFESNQNYLSTKYLLMALIDESKDRTPGGGVGVLLNYDLNLAELRMQVLSLSNELSVIDMPPNDDDSQPPGTSPFGSGPFPQGGDDPDDPSRVPLHRKPSDDTGEIALPLPDPNNQES